MITTRHHPRSVEHLSKQVHVEFIRLARLIVSAEEQASDMEVAFAIGDFVQFHRIVQAAGEGLNAVNEQLKINRKGPE